MSGKAFELSAPSVRRKKAAETKHVKDVHMKISCLLRPAVFLGLLTFCLDRPDDEILRLTALRPSTPR